MKKPEPPKDKLVREPGCLLFLLLIVLIVHVAFLGCAAPTRIDVTLRNTTDEVIVITAGAGPFQKRIRLKPGETWTGWIPKISASEIRVEVSK